MDFSFDIEEAFEKGYADYSTILLFGFSETEKKITQDAVASILVQDELSERKRRISIFATDDITDIIAIPYFIGIINFDAMSVEDRETVIQYFVESNEPLCDELIKLGYKEEDFSTPVIFAVNYVKNEEQPLRSLRVNNHILDNPEATRLAILSVLKDKEGIGIASTNSIRIYRVLSMYKTLIEEGIINKKMVDSLCYPDVISKSMFYRDIASIKEIENGKLAYDRNSGVYKLKR